MEIVAIIFTNNPSDDSLFNLLDENILIEGDGLTASVFQPGDWASTPYANQFNITSTPTVVFTVYENGLNYPIARLTGNQITASNIKKIMDQLKDLKSLGNGEFETSTGKKVSTGTELNIFYGDGGDGINPLGLLNINLPPFIWLIAMAAAGYKTTTAKKTSGRVIFGAATALAAANYLNAIKSKT